MAQATQQRKRNCPPMREEQMIALERFIAKSPNATQWVKKTIIWLSRQSQMLTVPVMLSVPGNTAQRLVFARELSDNTHSMCSEGAITPIGLFLDGMGTDTAFWHTHGEQINGEFETGEGRGTTIWFSPEMFDGEARLLKFDPDAIAAIELPK